MKTSERPSEQRMVDMEPKIPRKPSRLDPYRELLIFWWLHGEKQEWMAAELKRLYGVTIDRSSMVIRRSEWVDHHTVFVQTALKSSLPATR